ncbi:substrate-binding domain-containing protein [Rubellimicrobium sp. CFH 75288]|uniref:substrate-binding domain-containing protein n=1 Tax=Rubellimicrobium sp. CFH 75288 TaxID=2697034 RepID=UPI001412A376|nr:substrate-binding domain-containing protein [Rubellimicrobium sp. CFH 75288]NAZ37707.1 substrate-binding domain-containing protein [Rubellimicrobium sp. CFH 75288]
MKAWIAALAVAVALPGLAAAQEAEDRSGQRYVMVVPISGHPFWVAIRNGAQDAADQLGVRFEFTGPVEFDNRAQQQQIEQIAVTRPAAFLTGAFDPTMSDTIDRVTEMGIPVVTFDSDAPDSRRISFIGPDHYNIGWEYGRKMVEMLRERGLEEGQIGLLTAVDQTNLQVRIRGLEDYLAQNAPTFEVVATEDNRGDDQVTADRAKAMMTANPDIDGLIVINGTGSGMGTAINELGLAGQVTVLTSDVFDPILCAILDGSVQTTSSVNTYLEGYLALLFAYHYVNGHLDNVPGADVGVNKLPPVVDPGLFFIDASNAEQFLTGSCG